MIAIICIVILVIIIVFLAQSVGNRAIALEEAVKTASSDITVQRKRRIDLIYNLVDCVKQYDAHEAQLLSEIAEKMSRGMSYGEMELKSVLNATAFSHPELKSNMLYSNLMNELSVTENLMARYRENYNGAVNDYERYVKQFPARELLPVLGYTVRSFERLDFDAPDDAPKNLFDR